MRGVKWMNFSTGFLLQRRVKMLVVIRAGQVNTALNPQTKKREEWHAWCLSDGAVSGAVLAAGRLRTQTL